MPGTEQSSPVLTVHHHLREHQGQRRALATAVRGWVSGATGQGRSSPDSDPAERPLVACHWAPTSLCELVSWSGQMRWKSLVRHQVSEFGMERRSSTFLQPRSGHLPQGQLPGTGRGFLGDAFRTCSQEQRCGEPLLVSIGSLGCTCPWLLVLARQNK